MAPDDGTLERRMADGLDAITEMFAVDAMEIGKPYKDSCLARRDDNGQRRLACDWRQYPADKLHDEAQSQLVQANDHLRMLAWAMLEPQIIYSLFTLAHGAMVASRAQASHLIDPKSSVSDRLRRLLNHFYAANIVLRTMLVGVPADPDPAKLAQLGQELGELVRWAAQQRKLRIKYPKDDTSKTPVYFGEPIPWEPIPYRLFSTGVYAQPHTPTILLTGPSVSVVRDDARAAGGVDGDAGRHRVDGSRRVPRRVRANDGVFRGLGSNRAENNEVRLTWAVGNAAASSRITNSPGTCEPAL
ncbi:hypothetical protein ACIRRA_34835 [Nocardia sp. NPDC101769]|uniref:hypothetical protein n=1 Tax=Nocardia sp. NPDC101769 TaxID=3364333 RepID=UPI0037FC16CA